MVAQVTTCADKRQFKSRMAAESALAHAIRQWVRDPRRAAWPPHRVYRCFTCDCWHLTAVPKQESA